LAEASRDAANSSLSDLKRDDASVSVQNLSVFIKMLNKFKFTGKDLTPLEEKQPPVVIEGVKVQTDLACLVRSVSRSDVPRVGAVFLNTQAGNGLGTREETKRKRTKAGETVSLIVLGRLINEFSDFGEPHPEDCLHVYVRAGHFWSAPKSYVNKMENVKAEARSVANGWDAIVPPSDYDPARANHLQ
jgi:hypothetical protein